MALTRRQNGRISYRAMGSITMPDDQTDTGEEANRAMRKSVPRSPENQDLPEFPARNVDVRLGLLASSSVFTCDSRRMHPFERSPASQGSAG